MSESQADPARIASARPEMTAALMARTGLDERMLADLVDRFYAKVRADALLGPIFAAHVADWGPHLERMAAFWSSVALMTGRYHGTPVRPRPPADQPGAFRTLARALPRDRPRHLSAAGRRPPHRAGRAHRHLAAHGRRGRRRRPPAPAPHDRRALIAG